MPPRCAKVGYAPGSSSETGRPRMSHRASAVLGIVLFGAALGCSTPRIRIEHSCPPCIQLEPNATVGLETVIDPAVTKPEVSEVVRGELERHLLRGPYSLVAVSSAKVIV